MNEKLNFKAVNEDGMDEFLRNTIEGYRVEPKPSLWKSISRKLLWREISHFNFTNIPIKVWVTGALGLIILAGAIYNIVPSRPPSDVQMAIPTSAAIRNANSPVREVASTSSTPFVKDNHPATVGVKVRNTANQESSFEKPTETTSPKVYKSLAYANALPNSTVSHQTPDNAVSPELSHAMPLENTDIETSVVQTDISLIVPFETALLVINPHVDTILTINTANGISRFLKTKPSATQFLSVNLGVVPEMSFYSEPEDYSKVNVWINGGLSWHFSRFSLSTGIGLGYVYDKSKYGVEYKSNDSVGYFTNVLSYTTGVNNEIIYNTINKIIYDSLIHKNDYRTMNRYAYLQVPLLLGYRLYESGRMSLTFQTGPAISFLLGTRKSAPVIEYENARIIRIDDNTPSRVSTNWQLWGDLLLEIRMNRKISIYVEPSCKYFLNPMVEQENFRVNAPWSVGLGVGMQFNFAPKKKNP